MSRAALPHSLSAMSEADTAWLAGLMEGEGSFLITKQIHRTKDQPRISIGMTDRDVLERVVAVTGVGDVRQIRDRPNSLGAKTFYHWRIFGNSNCRELALRLRPWMGERRKAQIDALLASTADVPVREAGVCARGHKLTPENRLTRQGLRTGPCRICHNERRRTNHQSNQILY